MPSSDNNHTTGTGIGLKLHTPFVVDNRVDIVCLLRHSRTQREKMQADLVNLSEQILRGGYDGRHREAHALLQADIVLFDAMIARMWVSNNAG